MDEPAALPPGYERLVLPHRFHFDGMSGQFSECAVSAAVKRGGSADQVYVLCSELKKNHGTTVMHAWGPSVALELQLERHIYAEADGKLKQPAEPILDGLHYHVSKEEVAGWHFFEHHNPVAGDNSPHVVPVNIPYEGLLYGPRIDFSEGDIGALIGAMTKEVANAGFELQEAPT